ncbi:ABC-2 family transporter protein [Paenibacillus sp. CC-CFT747]|nr:ABC-2 family transporter protein [Paenibacillus sp. CC-CFT747]
MTIIARKAGKYAAIGKITVRSHLAYVTDFLVRSLFLLIILYIFSQLWGTTFAGEGSSTIAGYSFKQILWYLILTESMTMAFPSLASRMEEEVKSGDIGYKLTRPVSYLSFQYVSYLGEVYVRLLVNLAVAGLLGLFLLGPPSFGWGWAGFFAASIGAVTVNFMLTLILALSSFWVEETRGLEFVYNKILFTIGGMLMPLEIYPETLQRVCGWLPFQTILYFPARTAVAFDGNVLVKMIGIQAAWIAGLGLAAAWVYARGGRKLHVNGG